MRKILLAAASGLALAGSVQAAELLPDLVAVNARHLNPVKNGNGATVIRFTSGVFNRGESGAFLEFHPVHNQATNVTTAWQWIYDSNPATPPRRVNAGDAVYHPIHKHWHTQNIMRYQLRKNTLNGPMIAEADKVGYCLIDWVHVDGGGIGPTKRYFDCESQQAIQGVSPGWSDVYHHSTEGQELPMPAVPGVYYLVVVANPNGVNGVGLHPIEVDYRNNLGWVKISTSLDSSAWKIHVLDEGGLDAIKTAAITNR